MNINSILKVAFFTPGNKGRWGLPLIFIGPPGTGKTQRVEDESARFGLHAEVIIGSIREPTDVGGLARLEDDCFRLVPAQWAKNLGSKKHGVVVLDELNTNVPAMQAAMLRLATDGAVGEYMLPPTVRVIAMMNRVEESAGGWDLTPPLANRFGHIAWDAPSVGEWATWLLGGGEARVHNTAETAMAIEARVLQAWPQAYARAKGLVAGFLQKRPNLLHKMPAMGSPEAGKAWPSPRTWELATRALAGAEIHGVDQSDSEELISAFVGVGPAAELIVYRKEQDLPDPYEVLDEKSKFEHDPKRLDRTSAVLSSCAAAIASSPISTEKETKKRLARADVLWKILAEVGKNAADITIQPITVLTGLKLVDSDAADCTLARLSPILHAAGYRAKARGA